MALVTCKDCGKEFSTDAKRCPHCGANPPKIRKPMSRATMMLVGLIFLVAFAQVVMQARQSPEERAEKSAAEAQSREARELIANCQTEVRRKLKDPDSAQFQNPLEGRSPVVVTPDGASAIVITVRAKNSFGAYVPSQFVCRVAKDSAGRFQVVSVSEGPEATAPTRSSAQAQKAPAATSTPASGETIYKTNCAACHQPNGEGMPPTFPALVGSRVANGPAEAQILQALKGKDLEPPFAHMSDADLAAVITYVRTSWGNKGSMVRPSHVAALRPK